MNRILKPAALALSASLLVAAPAVQATIVIDDWNVTTGASVTDNAADSTPVLGVGGSGGTSLPRNSLMANLTAGNGVSTQDCVICQQGHFINDANSEGHGWWSWTPTGITLQGMVMLDFATGVAGADLILSFFGGGTLLHEVWWKDLPSTGLAIQTLTAILPTLTNVSAIYLDALSVGGSYTDPNLGGLGTRNYGAAATELDLNVDNLKVVLVPAPGALALLGIGLAGLGWRRRRAA